MDFYAKELLKSGGYTCVIRQYNGNVVTSNKNGIAPLMDYMADGQEGAEEAADKVIGKSAALLFIKMGVRRVYGEVMSEHAKQVLEHAHVAYSYGELVPYIINRQGDGMCPMEKAVLQTDDAERAYCLLKEKLDNMRNNTTKSGGKVDNETK